MKNTYLIVLLLSVNFNSYATSYEKYNITFKDDINLNQEGKIEEQITKECVLKINFKDTTIIKAGDRFNVKLIDSATNHYGGDYAANMYENTFFHLVDADAAKTDHGVGWFDNPEKRLVVKCTLSRGWFYLPINRLPSLNKLQKLISNKFIFDRALPALRN